MAKRKHGYVNFRQEVAVPLFAKTTNAIATGANTQEDYWIMQNGNYFELWQDGQDDEIAAGPMFTPAVTGWTVPIDANAGDGVQITQGMLAGPAISYTVGTDEAFFVRVGGYMGTIANHRHCAAGFRNLAAYVTAANGANILTAYDNKAIVGVTSITGDADAGTGVFTTTTSLATADLRTALAHAAMADATWFCYEVKVSAAGVTTYRIGTSLVSYALARAALAADANAVAFTFANATVLVPTIFITSNGTAVSDVQLIEYETGFQAL